MKRDKQVFYRNRRAQKGYSFANGEWATLWFRASTCEADLGIPILNSSRFTRVSKSLFSERGASGYRSPCPTASRVGPGRNIWRSFERLLVPQRLDGIHTHGATGGNGTCG